MNLVTRNISEVSFSYSFLIICDFGFFDFEILYFLNTFLHFELIFAYPRVDFQGFFRNSPYFEKLDLHDYWTDLKNVSIKFIYCSRSVDCAMWRMIELRLFKAMLEKTRFSRFLWF